jgi:hypothetical protein
MNFTVEQLADVLLNDVLFPLREGIFETEFSQGDFCKIQYDSHLDKRSNPLDDLYYQLERLQLSFDQAFSKQYPKVAETFQVELVYSRFGQILFYVSKKSKGW